MSELTDEELAGLRERARSYGYSLVIPRLLATIDADRKRLALALVALKVARRAASSHPGTPMYEELSELTAALTAYQTAGDKDA